MRRDPYYNADIITGDRTAPRPPGGIWQGLIVGLDEQLDPLLKGPYAAAPAQVFDVAGACNRVQRARPQCVVWADTD